MRQNPLKSLIPYFCAQASMELVLDKPLSYLRSRQYVQSFLDLLYMVTVLGFRSGLIGFGSTFNGKPCGNRELPWQPRSCPICEHCVLNKFFRAPPSKHSQTCVVSLHGSWEALDSLESMVFDVGGISGFFRNPF